MVSVVLVPWVLGILGRTPAGSTGPSLGQRHTDFVEHGPSGLDQRDSSGTHLVDKLVVWDNNLGFLGYMLGKVYNKDGHYAIHFLGALP